MIRAALSVIAGFVAWMLAATVANFLLRAAMPGYAAVEASMTFTLPMLVGRLAVGLVASLAAGFVCSLVSAHRPALYVLAGLLVAVFVPVHYQLWTVFPVWYHIIFLGSLVPLTLVGGMVHRSWRSGAAGPAHGSKTHV